MNTIIILAAKYLYVVSIIVGGIYIFTQPKNERKSLLILAIISLPLTYLVAKITAHFYYDPRPFVVSHAAPLIPHAADNGFPSDHTLLTSAIAAVIFWRNKKLGFILLVIALAVGAARIRAGIHHWIDVVGAIVIAALVTAVVGWWLLPKAAKQITDNR